MGNGQLKELFGQRMRKLRRSQRVTQGQLAESARISEEYLSKIERGLASPSFEVISRLCSALHVTSLELFGVRAPLKPMEDPVGPLVVAETAMSAVFGAVPVGFFVSTHPGRLRLASDSFAWMLGYESGEDMQRKVRNLATDVYRSAGERGRVLAQVPQDGSLASLESTLVHTNGSDVPVRVYMRRCVGPGSADPCYAGFLLTTDK